MAKTKGPAFSASASGTIGNALTYQKNKAGKYVRGYSKPGGTPSSNQEIIRGHHKEAIALWQFLTDDEKELWNNYVLGKTIEDNLAALWPMNEGSGIILPGHSRHKVQGDITGTTWVDGKFGGALNFGSGDRVICGNPPSLNFGTGDFSLEAAIKTTGIFPGQSYATIIRKMWASIGYFMFINTLGGLRIGVYDGTGTTITSIGTINNNEWRHVVFTANRDGDGIIYIDGDEDNKGSIAAHQGSTDTWQIFSLSYGTIWPYIGIMDEVALYNRVLTPAEVKQRANRRDPKITFPTGTIPVKLPSPKFYSGYHCFVSQYHKNKEQGIIPWRLPTGVYF